MNSNNLDELYNALNENNIEIRSELVRALASHARGRRFESYCLYHLITNVLIQLKGVKISDICPRNRAFFNFWRFASRWKLVRTEEFLIERWKPIRKKMPLILSFLYFLTSITILAKKYSFGDKNAMILGVTNAVTFITIFLGGCRMNFG